MSAEGDEEAAGGGGGGADGSSAADAMSLDRIFGESLKGLGGGEGGGWEGGVVVVVMVGGGVLVRLHSAPVLAHVPHLLVNPTPPPSPPQSSVWRANGEFVQTV